MQHMNPAPARARNQLLGFLDRLEDGIASGWALNIQRPLDPIMLHVVIDGYEVAQINADQLREDVREDAGHPTGRVGFEFVIPEIFWDNLQHFISFRVPGGSALNCGGSDPDARPTDGMWFKLRRMPKVEGCVDGLRIGQLHGWAVRTDPGTTKPHGACDILITCQGNPIGIVRADRYRGDVASVTGSDPNCGFQFTVPKELRTSGVQNFRFEVWPERIELPGSPLVTTLIQDSMELTLIEMTERLATMSREILQFKSKIADLLPEPGYCMPRYDEWARAYQPALRRRAASLRAAEKVSSAPLEKPLISVIVPTYRPLMADFTAAVESVFAQTYANWELVIIDDCSRDPKLTKLIKSFVVRDKRVRALPRKKNGNISEATNTAIMAARGEYVAFFDHDDLLFDEALDIMVRAIRNTKAKMLYSDEDKIDQAGYFSEPNFKPDWNYRYILGANYVCHLMLVRRDVLAQAGPLQTKYNGAQDHDLVLRLSEILSDDEIHHVPEILYHWRKTPNSTASDISTKSYAVDAGVLAVSDHLKRREIPAEVTTILGMTLYSPEWKFHNTPSVCIIIPFREQISMTRSCLETVLENTAYANFEVILVDNWSISPEAEDFVADAVKDKRVRVLQVGEPFNFSRLNNLAVAQTNAEFLVFMNNDLFPSNDMWLRHLVNEALVDTRVAAVGGRYTYPSGAIQHAGVIVGTQGIAMHQHRGAPHTDYGYIGRILLSHEVTAVTAACMLIRASVFRELGGFDEVAFKVAYNDVDLCLKVRDAGYKIVYSSNCMAIHHESISRGSDDHPARQARFEDEQKTLLQRWGNHPLFLHDPAYNPHLTINRQPFYDLQDPN